MVIEILIQIIIKQTAMKVTKILKTFIAILAVATLAAFGSPTSYEAVPSAEYVYICTGPQSKRYHKTKNCKGLDRCSKEVIKVTKAFAEEKGRTPCKGCY